MKRKAVKIPIEPCHCGAIPKLSNEANGMRYRCPKCKSMPVKTWGDAEAAHEEWKDHLRDQTPACVAYAKQPIERKLFGYQWGENTLHVHLLGHLWTIIKRREQ